MCSLLSVSSSQELKFDNDSPPSMCMETTPGNSIGTRENSAVLIRGVAITALICFSCNLGKTETSSIMAICSDFWAKQAIHTLRKRPCRMIPTLGALQIPRLRKSLKPSLENFQHYFASVWDEYNCVVVWTFFRIAFLWDWNENWPFPVLWPLLSFPDLLEYWVQHFHSIIF